MFVGVVAFHGDFAEHIALLRSMKQRVIEVRSVKELAEVDHLIIPGGESTVISRFLESTGVGKEIQRRVKDESLAVYGTCAGAILLAHKVTGKHAPKTLRLMDITVERNAYGTQMQSFSAELRITGVRENVPVAFIRAPIITNVGKGIEMLAKHDGNPVLVRCGRVLAGTFHPEVRDQTVIHKLFLTM